MKKNTLMIVAMVVLGLFIVLQFYQLQQIKNQITTNAVAGEELSDYDKMMAEHHPDQAKQKSGAASSANNLPQMVGGC